MRGVVGSKRIFIKCLLLGLKYRGTHITNNWRTSYLSHYYRRTLHFHIWITHNRRTYFTHIWRTYITYHKWFCTSD